jgi:hypothetical protein
VIWLDTVKTGLAVAVSYVKSVSETRLTPDEIVSVPLDNVLATTANEVNWQLALDVVPEVLVTPKSHVLERAEFCVTSNSIAVTVPSVFVQTTVGEEAL